MLDPDGPVPLYIQLANLLESQIRAGKLLPDRAVPSEATLQQEHGVSRGTARKAIELLRGRGLVITVQGRGTYVCRELPNA